MSDARIPQAAPAATSSVSLRPFPYPFRAALSICNDADYLTHAGFRRLHRFLNSDADTEWGPGLDLHVGGSFFMFRSPGSPNEFTVFDGLSSTITDDGESILECARLGSLDMLHTYGDFSDPSHFTRALAETALDALRTHDVAVETWVNHGPPTNVQCVGTREEWQGDAPGTAGYHADLTIEYGVRWVWTGTEMVDHIALEARRPARLRHRGLARWASRRRGNQDRSTKLVEPYHLRDGQPVRRFYRYAGLGGRTPVLDDLPAQLSSRNLDELVRASGYAIVYQHLATRRVRPGFGIGAYGPVDDSWFAPAELAALRGLAERYHRGDIWVTPTTSLLRYRDAHEALRWSAWREADHDAIVIDLRATGHLTQRDLADLTFYCERPETARVYVESEEGRAPVHELHVNPADETLRPSLTLLPSDEGPRTD
jgi:hypothetical protein